MVRRESTAFRTPQKLLDEYPRCLGSKHVTSQQFSGVRCQCSASPPTSQARSGRSSKIQVAEIVGVTALFSRVCRTAKNPAKAVTPTPADVSTTPSSPLTDRSSASSAGVGVTALAGSAVLRRTRLKPLLQLPLTFLQHPLLHLQIEVRRRQPGLE